MIGIRSVDTQFSAIICIEASDLIRVQKNDFDIHHETEIESERLTNTIDLMLLSNNDKVLQISSNNAQEKDLIVNELSRAIVVQRLDDSPAPSVNK